MREEEMGERRSMMAKIWPDKGKENRKIKRENRLPVENRGKRKETRERGVMSMKRKGKKLMN